MTEERAMVLENLRLRQFNIDDLDQVVKINWTCLPENYSTYFYQELYNRYPETFIIAEVNGRIAGYVMCRVELGFSGFLRGGPKKRGHVVSIAVLEEHRRQGIGRALMEQAIEGMKKYSADECFLEVRVSNEAAIQMYRKMGFQVAERLRSYYRDGEDSYVMRLEL